MSRLRNPLLALLGGSALNTAFPDVGAWPLALVAVALLWWVLEHATARQAFGLGWLFGMAFLAPHVWWAYHAVGVVPWAALVIVEGLSFALAGMAWAHVRRSKILRYRAALQAPVFALMWVGAEQLRSVVPFGGFPWGRIAFSQLDSPVARFAWLGGAPLVSFVVVCAGALFGLAFESMRAKLALRTALAAFVGVAMMGAGLAVPLDTRATDGTLRVGVVQGNVPNEGLDAFARAREVTDNHLTGTRELLGWLPGPMDLLIWPENSADFDPRTDAQTFDIVSAVASEAGVPLLMSSNDYSAPGGRYNASLLWSVDAQLLGQYNKQRPAPFAEYVPIRDVARFFSKEVDRVHTDVVAGTEVAIIPVRVERLDADVQLGVIICFEVAYDWVVRDAVNAGAQVVIVQTNNANFGLTAESTQQLAMTRMRAIESGRAAVQASTVGVSAIVAPDGQVTQRTGLFTAEQMYAELPLRSTPTPAMSIGEPLEWVFLLLPGLVLVYAIVIRIRERYEW